MEDETNSIDRLAGGEWRIPMKCHRIRRYALGLAGLFLIPPLLWIGVVLVAQTGWARRHVIAALEASSGRSVGL